MVVQNGENADLKIAERGLYSSPWFTNYLIGIKDLKKKVLMTTGVSFVIFFGLENKQRSKPEISLLYKCKPLST